MAEKSDNDFPLTLTTNDILGIIQRALMELHVYCGQTPGDVNPAVCMAYLERTAQFVGQLPSHQRSSNAGKGAEAPARAN